MEQIGYQVYLIFNDIDIQGKIFLKKYNLMLSENLLLQSMRLKKYIVLYKYSSVYFNQIKNV